MLKDKIDKEQQKDDDESGELKKDQEKNSEAECENN